VSNFDKALMSKFLLNVDHLLKLIYYQFLEVTQSWFLILVIHNRGMDFLA